VQGIGENMRSVGFCQTGEFDLDPRQAFVTGGVRLDRKWLE
jgi:hypothetical protein